VASVIEEIERIFHEDVLPITNDILKLNNSSRPKLLTLENFYEVAEREAKKIDMELPEDELIAFLGEDLITYLNQHALEGELFNEWSAAAMAFFQPYAFFLEKTDIGEQLLKSGKLHAANEKFNFLDGVGRFVEEEVGNRLKTKGYLWERIQPDLMKNLESSQYRKAYEICKTLWEEAWKTDLCKLYPKGAKPNEIIVACILSASVDISKDFNTAFLELENMSIPQIFAKSELYLEAVEKPSILPTELEEMQSYIKEIGLFVATERPISDIREILKKTKEKLLHVGKNYEIASLTELGEQASQLYGIFEKQLPKLRIEEIPDSKTCVMLLQNFLTDTENFLKQYK